MAFVEFASRIFKFFFRKMVYAIFQFPRMIKFKLLSSSKRVIGKPRLYQPVQLNGKGEIVFQNNVRFGVDPSPFLFNGYGYVESRKENSRIVFGENVWINNNFVAISEGEGIEIGENTLIGSSCEIVDSDFHDIDPVKRLGGIPQTAKVVIGKNVFIGSNVKILKGVVVGDNTVIANGSIVVRSIPGNVIAGGVPAKVIRSI